MIDSTERISAQRGWGPGQVGLGVLAVLIASSVEAVIVSGFDPHLKTLAGKLVLQAMLAPTLIAVAFVAASGPRSATAAPEQLGLREPTRPPYRPAAIAYGVYLAFALAWGILIHPHQENVTRDLGVGSSDLGTVAAAFLIIVAAPFSEEIFFRGFIFGGLRSRLPFAGAALISGAIFGIFHFSGLDSWGVVPQLAFLGVVLAWLYERTGSIWPTMAVHALNNTFAFLLLTS